MRGDQGRCAIVGNLQREIVRRVRLRDERAERKSAAIGVQCRVGRTGEQREGQRLWRLVGVRGAGGEGHRLADVHSLAGNRRQGRRRVGRYDGIQRESDGGRVAEQS